MRLHVALEGYFRKGESLVRLSLRIHDESLHGQSIAMLGVLFEDLIRRLDTY
jgi:hypothetical protein